MAPPAKYYPSAEEIEAEIAKAVRFYEITIEHLTGKQIHRKRNETQPAQKLCAGCCSLSTASKSNVSFKKKKAHDPNAPYDGCDEPDDTGQNAKSGYRKGVG